jgi:hypothetical protein
MNVTTWIVEHFGSKGWEVSKETPSFTVALDLFKVVIKEGYAARLTCEQSG